MIPVEFKYPHDVLLGMLRAGGLPDQGVVHSSVSHALPRWAEPTPECEECGDPGVASVSWHEIRCEQQAALSQASMELGPQYLECPIDREWFFCQSCAYAVISDALSDPFRDRTAIVEVEVSGWWIARNRQGGAA
ncbi:hypothetical protein [Hoyosella altamirensis]|uniref:Uncharacterized protein n=1 Tax=Hoyosella altamirensis TaxID=616997 RepID=A0A839RT98_9ACTN|nr:hypothetical protein [Hoyosella altamirensis]MBB3039426.1 hypothetical protein [Hoyosella altamirensis]MBB3039998.1 hypothetical protein [Hoyosella altamirensis]